MSDAKIVVGQGSLRRDTRLAGPEWNVLLMLGVLFAVVGGVDVALVWFPASFGVAEFEFASVATSLNSMPVVTIGLGLVVAASSALEYRKLAWVTVVMIGAVGLLLVMSTVLFGLTVPLALQAEVEPIVMLGIKKQAAKSTVQILAYGVAYLLLLKWAVRIARTQPS